MSAKLRLFESEYLDNVASNTATGNFILEGEELFSDIECDICSRKQTGYKWPVSVDDDDDHVYRIYMCSDCLLYTAPRGIEGMVKADMS